MTDIRNTVMTSLPGGVARSDVSRYAEPVISALEAREHAATEALLQVARGEGMDETAARAAITQAGLMFRPVPAQATPAASNGDAQAELTSIRHDLSGLLERIDRALG